MIEEENTKVLGSMAIDGAYFTVGVSLVIEKKVRIEEEKKKSVCEKV